MSKQGLHPTQMIDVSGKPPMLREAAAEGEIFLSRETLDKVLNNDIPKGQVLEVARVAAIMAAKNTPQIIPLCHPININTVIIDYEIQIEPSSIKIKSSVKGIDRTGVEMEALTAVSAAALTIYDMCKFNDKKMVISQIRLISKKKTEIK